MKALFHYAPVYFLLSNPKILQAVPKTLPTDMKWVNCQQKKKKDKEMWEKRGRDNYSRNPWDAPSTALLNRYFNIHPFQEREAKLKAKMVFKALNGLLPIYIAEKFLIFNAVHSKEKGNST